MIGLEGCVVSRPAGFGDAVEIVRASAVARVFPTRVSESLGVCLKLGAEHAVSSNGQALRYPADALCVREPGCVWGCEPAPVGFLSIDIGSAALPDDMGRRAMRFMPRGLDLLAVARRLEASDVLLREQTLAELVVALVEGGAVDGCRSLAQDAPVRRACERLAEALDQPLPLDQLAREVGVNKFVLIRRFRAQIGSTPHRYRMLLRVERARALLARGVEMVEVANALGFADQAHLSRAFKEVVGIAPGAYVRRVLAVRE